MSTPKTPKAGTEALRAVAKAIALVFQLRDLGREDESGDFTCSSAQIDLLERLSNEAADAAIAAYLSKPEHPALGAEPVAHLWQKMPNDHVMWVCEKCRIARAGYTPGFSKPNDFEYGGCKAAPSSSPDVAALQAENEHLLPLVQ